MPLSREERERFLAQPHVASLAVESGPGRGPLAVPMWYRYTPGGDVWVLTTAGSTKARLIEAAGRFTLLVQRTAPTVRYVSVEGPVVRTSPGSLELFRELAAHYLPADGVDLAVEISSRSDEKRVVFHMRPEHWLSRNLWSA